MLTTDVDAATFSPAHLSLRAAVCLAAELSALVLPEGADQRIMDAIGAAYGFAAGHIHGEEAERAALDAVKALSRFLRHKDPVLNAAARSAAMAALAAGSASRAERAIFHVAWAHAALERMKTAELGRKEASEAGELLGKFLARRAEWEPELLPATASAYESCFEAARFAAIAVAAKKAIATLGIKDVERQTPAADAVVQRTIDEFFDREYAPRGERLRLQHPGPGLGDPVEVPAHGLHLRR